MKKKILPLLLTCLMVFGMLPATAFANESGQAQNFADMPNNWSTAALQKAVDNELLKGYEVEGKTLINADAQLKRAEMAAVVGRAFGAVKTAELHGVTDVPSKAWYASDMAKGVMMGTFMKDSKMRPESNITRQEAFVVLARAFKVSSDVVEYTALENYSDKANVAAWAKKDLNAMVEAGYVQGSGGKLNSNANISRAEFATVMDNLVKQYIDMPGEATDISSSGNVLIRVPGVTLKDLTIKGDLIIADGVGEGDVTLDNVKVEGRTLVRGGGENSIIIKGSSDLGKVVVCKVDGKVRIVVEGTAEVEVIYVDDGSDDVLVEGVVGTLEVSGDNITAVATKAILTKAVVSGDRSTIILRDESDLKEGTITGNASKIIVENGATADKITISGSDAKVEGNGTVKAVEVKADGDNASITTPNTKIETAKGAEGVTAAGGAPVDSGTSATNNNAGTWIVTPPRTGGGGGTPAPAAEFAGGTGTAEDPYQVANAEQLDNVRNYLDKYFIQIENIDLEDYFAFGAKGYNAGSGWDPIGNDTNSFSGNYDGNNKTISNLKIARSSQTHIGLFGKNEGCISNVSLTGVDVNGKSYVGGLIGYNEGGTVIESNVSGSINGTSGATGGLIGFSQDGGVVYGCYSEASVYAPNSHYVGGLMGAFYYGSLSDSYSSGSVTGGDYYIGGLVGSNYDGTIDRCFATGDVIGSQKSVGGLVGDNFFGIINNCYATGSVNGINEVGGLVGYNLYNGTLINNSYSTGSVNGAGSEVGGLVGRNDPDSTVTNSYWDTQTSGLATSAGGTGYSTAAMIKETNSVSIYVNWDFTNTWAIEEGVSYPYLQWQGDDNIPYPPSGFAGGDGTPENPYQVANAEQLDNIREYLDSHFIQIANIDLGVTPWNEGEGWEPIGGWSNGLSGSYDGNSFIIENLTIDYEGYASYKSLFQELAPDGIIKNVQMENVNVTGNSYVSALVAYQRGGEIRNCSAEGIIQSNNNAGILVAGSDGLITGSYSSGSVIALEVNGQNYYFGGLVGRMSDPNAKIYNSYSTAEVLGDHTVGGLVGNAWGETINNCYSMGKVTGSARTGGLVGQKSDVMVINNSYWDTQTSGLASSADGTGKTTAEMTQQSTFADWDFDTIWGMNPDSNGGYPFLRWQGYEHIPDDPSEFAGGDGTSENPWLISTPQQLDNIRNYLGPDNTDKHFRLINDINLSEYLGEDGDGYNYGAGWLPIGEQTETHGYQYFTGVFDGNGKTISNLYIYRPEMTNVALFRGVGYTTGQGKIINLNIEDADISGRAYVSVLAGRLTGIIEQITINGTVEGSDDVGGIIGINETGSIKDSIARGSVTIKEIEGKYVGGIVGRSIFGSIEDCSNEATVINSGHYTGGLAGYNSSNITNSSNIGAVTGNRDYTGGLVGYNYNSGHIRYSFNSGPVTGLGSSTGGLAGRSEWYIQYCYTTGKVTSEGDNTGGLVGHNRALLTDSYNWSEVQGTNYTGGLIGKNEGMNSESYASILRTYSIGAISGENHTGGLVGSAENYSSVRFSFWNTETSNQDTSAGGTDKTTVEMKQISTYPTTESQSWDFDTIWGMNPDENSGYPFLRWQGYEHIPDVPSEFAGGDGTPANPYQVATAEQLDNVRNHLDKYFIQTADIDLAEYLADGGAGYNDGAGWMPIGNSTSFIGNYNGNGKSISNLKVVRYGFYIGLFGQNEGTIRNVSLSEVDIKGKASVAGLIGINKGGTVTNSSVTGSIYSSNGGDNSYVGGLIGYIDGGQVSGCYSSATVSAPSGDKIGGLIGSNKDGGESSIANCYATGAVTGINNIGGLIGVNYSSNEVTNSYAIGAVAGTGSNVGGLIGYNGGTVTNSYWDIETTNQADSNGGTGYPTSAMIKDTNSVPIYVEWDFTDIWSIEEGTSYPYLQWQGSENIPYPIYK